MNPKGVHTWAWCCGGGEKLLHWDELVQRFGQHWHWDSLLQDWCGPVRKATVE